MRKITDSETARLIERGCDAEDWSLLRVSDDFDVEKVRNVRFVGENTLEKVAGTVSLSGVEMPCVIENAVLCNCSIGEGALVSGVSLLSGYRVERGAAIVNCGTVTAKSDATFGIATRVAVVNEGGGREVAICPGLSSNVAYLMAFRRDKERLVSALQKLVDTEAEAVRGKAVIGCNARVVNTATIEDVRVGDFATIEGAGSLRNGTVASCQEQPSTVGTGVVASDFVFAEGSSVTDASMLKHCFVGQCTQVGGAYSAENLVAFANCQFFNGEAASVLAGPFTVTHHKTTLLIAAAYSFFNAGSATNASNHHYKLGPNHQAVYERGVKTGSGSYVLEPAQLGAFTMVVGSHKSHPNTSAFPFSYLIDKSCESYLIPAQNLKTIGNFRDEEKWQSRDRRHPEHRRDRFTPEVFNAQSISRMLAAAEKLHELLQSEAETILYEGVRLRKALMKRAAAAYEQVAEAYIVKAFLEARKNGELPVNGESVDVEWIDFGGLVADKADVEQLEAQLESGAFASLAELNAAILRIETESKRKSHLWLLSQAAERYGLTASASDEQLLEAAQRMAKTFTDIENSILADAEKEYSGRMLVSYGLDRDAEAAQREFDSVRGTLADNAVLARVREFYEKQRQVALDIIRMFDPQKN